MKILRRVWCGKIGGSGIRMRLTTVRGGGGVRKQVFRVKRLLRMSFFLIANACKLHLQLQQSSLHLFPHSVVPI